MNRDERDRLVSEHQELVKKIAFNVSKNLPPSSFDLEDLIGWGQVGLLEAANNYDPSRYGFSVWASLRIRGAMIDGMRSMAMFPRQVYGVRRDVMTQTEELSSRLGRMPTHDEMADALDFTEEEYRRWMSWITQMEHMSSATSQAPDETLHNLRDGEDPFASWECREDILEAMSFLKERQKMVIFYTFWVGLTQPEIAEITGMHPGSIHQIKQEALSALRERLTNYGDWKWNK